MIAIVCSEFNSEVTDGLLEGCLVALNKDGVSSEKIDIHKVPGAFELPGKVKLLSRGDTSYDAIITLGCVIKGETDHYHYISQACLLYTSPSPRDAHESRMPSSA